MLPRGVVFLLRSLLGFFGTNRHRITMVTPSDIAIARLHVDEGKRDGEWQSHPTFHNFGSIWHIDLLKHSCHDVVCFFQVLCHEARYYTVQTGSSFRSRLSFQKYRRIPESRTSWLVFKCSTQGLYRATEKFKLTISLEWCIFGENDCMVKSSIFKTRFD